MSIYMATATLANVVAVIIFFFKGVEWTIFEFGA